MVKLAFLDLIPIREGEGVSDALAHAAAMAQAAPWRRPLSANLPVQMARPIFLLEAC